MPPTGTRHHSNAATCASSPAPLADYPNDLIPSTPRRTTPIVAAGSRAFVEMCRQQIRGVGRKILAAPQLRDDGYDIRIVTESAFLAAARKRARLRRR
jgi:hypothetical protein